MQTTGEAEIRQLVETLVGSVFGTVPHIRIEPKGVGINVSVWSDEPEAMASLIGRHGSNAEALRQLVAFWGKERHMVLNLHIVPNR